MHSHCLKFVLAMTRPHQITKSLSLDGGPNNRSNASLWKSVPFRHGKLVKTLILLTSKCVSKMRISEKNWDHPDGCRSESPSALWIRFWGLFVRLHGTVFTTLHSWAFSNRDPEGGFGTSGANLKAPAPRYLQMPFECDESCRRDTWVEANEPI